MICETKISAFIYVHGHDARRHLSYVSVTTGTCVEQTTARLKKSSGFKEEETDYGLFLINSIFLRKSNKSLTHKYKNVI